MRSVFAALPPDVPVMTGIREAVLDFNEVEPAELPWHRQRMQLILNTPALQAHSTLRYEAWRQVVADYAAERLGLPSDALLPQTIGHASLGAALAAYERWLRVEGAELRSLLDEAFRALENGLTGAP